MKPIYFLFTLLLFASVQTVFSNSDKDKELKEKKAKDKEFGMEIGYAVKAVNLDGSVDEGEWDDTEVISGFVQQIPNEGMPANQNTEVRVKYDEDFLYIAATLYQNAQEGYVISSLKRDFRFYENDAFAVTLGPYDDGNNGFMFAVNPYNIQMEGLIFNGDRVSDVWDNKWYSSVKRFDDRWEVEMAIPFKTLRFTEGSDYWRVNFLRNDRKNFERSSWVPVPLNQRIQGIAFSGYLNWDEPLKKPGANIAVIPYIAGNGAKDYRSEEGVSSGAAAGFDAKVALSPSMNLDLTFNPDFSTVEVDQQQTNLNRFELFFPERRQFFLENADLFGDFGFSSIRPFFSRRIGIATDSMGRSSNNRILYGARLNGNVGDNTRVGLLNMQTDTEDAVGYPGQNYTVATAQRKVFSRSNIAAIFVNRQTTGSVAEPGRDIANYNRVVGLDYNLASADNKWTGKFFYHQSFSPDVTGDSKSHASHLSYNTKKWIVRWNHEYVGENYNAEVGFVPRSSYWRFEPSMMYRLVSNSSKIFQQTFQLAYDVYTDESFGLKTDERMTFAYRLYFKNTSTLQFRVFNEYVYLFSPFDPTRTGGEQLAAGTDYSYTRTGLTYSSDSRKLFNYSSTVYAGEYFNGERLFVNTNINYRFQPYGNISLFAEYNKIDMPDPYNDASLWLVGPKMDVSFTDKLFLSTFVQYNSQIDNVNINTRFQWRFKPVSDLFVVFTDNYHPESLQIKNRALILKLTYWINV
ncbi:hypothetical protein A33Q_1958 [Indibacter alkaliphilus LW1]|uniref:DUF5916 domain-containing protein n=1 Tax=Indibacter alkaliphilus (strain CCUG 57479 / KCTC 22604 / LW1) TaxID=1189612 RepID=S2DIL9_INDAL|nr:DUF5916 domain-containing protein [Indibacter alkaliphilus]EOZ97040.1 hypothetical protein A33Q_1958 [Indibacter alkaliphilus LW1]